MKEGSITNIDPIHGGRVAGQPLDLRLAPRRGRRPWHGCGEGGWTANQ